MVRKKTETESK